MIQQPLTHQAATPSHDPADEYDTHDHPAHDHDADDHAAHDDAAHDDAAYEHVYEHADTDYAADPDGAYGHDHAAVDEQDIAYQDDRAYDEYRPGAAACARVRRSGWRALVLRGWPLRSRRCVSRTNLAWLRRPGLRKFAMVAGSLGAVVLVACSALWWRLSSGPIELDIATPWLSAAIKQNFGSSHDVEIGGTQLERDAAGRTSLRIRDIVVRDADGTVVASAPKAEVGLSGWGLLTGRIRAERLSLVGAEMAVRIETDSNVTVFAGANKRPFVTASATATPAVSTGAVPMGALPTGNLERPRLSALAPVAVPALAPAARGDMPDFAAMLAWLERLDASGLDGRDLTEIGLKGGNLTVDDQRNGKQWTFTNIDLGVTRPKGGGLAVTLGSQNAQQPWLIRAALTPGVAGRRIIDIETQKVSAKDIMLAMRLGEVSYEPELLLSGRIHADIGPDGVPHMIDGKVLVDKGYLIDADDPQVRVAIDRAEFNLEWDAARRILAMPFQIVSGGNRLTLLGQANAPEEPGGAWGLRVSGGTVVLGPPAGQTGSLVLNRIALNLKLDLAARRIDIEHGEIGNTDLGVALSGSIDYSSGDPRLAVGVAGTRMSLAAMKSIWPFFGAPKVRAWVEEHIAGGTIERLMIATNAPMSTMKASGPPIPDDGLAVEIVGHGADIRPVHGLPAIRDADFNVRVTGRTATINVGRGNIDISPGRKLSITSGVFEVPDTFPKGPPAKIQFRLDGSVQAAAELLSLERLSEHAGVPLDPATSRGNLTAQVALGLPLKADLAPGSSTYTIAMDVNNFAAERIVMGHKVEAATLKVNANNQGYWIRGDVKINGIPANLDYRKPRDTDDAEVRLSATLDEAARGKLGFDMAGLLSGPVPIKLIGRVPSNDNESSRLNIEADLTPAKIDNLLPGWSKQSGRPARATFAMISKPAGGTRFEDMAIDAPGTSVKGTLESDANGNIVSASFPVFSLSDGDKTTLKAERAPDGALRVILRGDVYDGRGLVKTGLAGPANAKQQKHDKDIDLDVKIGTVAGFHGETLRGLDLKLSRRSGTITNFALNAKIGRGSPISGDLRRRSNSTRQALFVETADAGAFFRFSDIYAKIVGGEMWVAIDPQSAEQAPQDGILNIRDFIVRGEAGLDRVAGQPAGQQQTGVEFSRLRVDFTRSLGRFAIKEGLVRGPVIGATVDGYIDYMRDDLRMRGTFVPLYGLNNMFGQIPIFGLFLGGSNEGLLGVTYEVVGPPSSPTLRVNPISAVAPGLLRKFFEFPNTNAPAPQSFADPNRD
ncbi:MAG: DUF3971 domain-containing protein [Xanthobacteraceae bacterium]